LRESRPRRIVERTVDIAAGETGGGGLLHPDLVALSDLALKLLTTDFAALSEGDIERLAADHLVVHLSDSLGGLVGRGEADETKALGGTFLIAHDLAAGDGAESLELATELLIVCVVVQVLDVEVDALVFAHLLELGGLVGLAELLFTFGLLLGTSDEELLAVEVKVVQLVDGLLSLLVPLVVDETETLALALLVLGDDGGGHVTELLEQLLKLL
jgi:hypothetical protein